MKISVVIPLLNERESLPELFDWIARVMQSNRFLYEVIFVDDGSTDDSWSYIENLSKDHNEVVGIKFSQNFGKKLVASNNIYPWSLKIVLYKLPNQKKHFKPYIYPSLIKFINFALQLSTPFLIRHPLLLYT